MFRLILAKPINIKKTLLFLIITSFVVRFVLAFQLELTNDEVNYWLYAIYPAISHYEHPAMVGFFIQLSTLNLALDSELFIRLTSVILGTVNIYLIFITGKKIKDELTGLYSAFLYTTSLYCFVITGIFIQPDTPMVFFWLLSIYYLIDGLFFSDDKKFNTSILAAGLFIGLGLASKYITIFLWAGFVIYILIYDRKWFFRKEIYLGQLISLICFSPSIYWNFNNDAGTVSFWYGNVRAMNMGIRFDQFLPEILGQITYNNPVNFFLIILGLAGFKKLKFPNMNSGMFLILIGMPLAVFFVLVSFTGRTLPHWSGPGYISLIILASAYLSGKYSEKQKFFPVSIQLSFVTTLLIIIFGFAQINYGLFELSSGKTSKPDELGKNDLTLDIYGWKQAAGKFKLIDSNFISKGMMKSDAPLFSDKWYNAGHIDYYIARPLKKNVFAVGNLSEIRKYLWVNKERGGWENVKEGYYISPSRDYTSPHKECSRIFSIIVPMDTIRIVRNGKIVENMFVFIMKK